MRRSQYILDLRACCEHVQVVYDYRFRDVIPYRILIPGGGGGDAQRWHVTNCEERVVYFRQSRRMCKGVDMVHCT